MIFYKHFIGDFQRDTGHLSLTERGAYRALMDHYYATERPLPNDHAALCRISGAVSKDEQRAVRNVMAFFQATDSGLTHKRIEAEIQRAEGRADTNRRIALEREERRRQERNEARGDHESCSERATDREPSHKPEEIHNPPTPRKRGVALPSKPPEVEQQTWNDWTALRKAKRAPVSPTVLAHAAVEAEKAGMTLDAFLQVWCARGSQGLEADWLKPHERGQPSTNRTDRQLTTAGLMLGVLQPSRGKTDDAPPRTPRLVA